MFFICLHLRWPWRAKNLSWGANKQERRRACRRPGILRARATGHVPIPRERWGRLLGRLIAQGYPASNAGQRPSPTTAVCSTIRNRFQTIRQPSSNPPAARLHALRDALIDSQGFTSIGVGKLVRDQQRGHDEQTIVANAPTDGGDEFSDTVVEYCASRSNALPDCRRTRSVSLAVYLNVSTCAMCRQPFRSRPYSPKDFRSPMVAAIRRAASAFASGAP